MERLKDVVLREFENFLGPFDWKFVRSGGSTAFTGNFLVFDRKGKIRHRVQGRIVLWTRLPVQVYLYDPPKFIKNHRHGSCLQLLRPGDNWFKLHFEKPATDFPTAYSYVEHLLTEAFNSKR